MERGILFSAPMVRALLDGRKTQTRRVVKPQPYVDRSGNFCVPNKRGGLHRCYGQHMNGQPHWQDFARWHCPYGDPGGALWVRETWGMNHYDYALGPIPKERPADLTPEYLTHRATEDDPEIVHELRWRPSIHMPRWASRITLRVTDVRVERLNEISTDDARAEGLEWVSPTFGIGGIAETWSQNPIDAYAKLWEHINGHGSWAANPWVWAVSFERLR